MPQRGKGARLWLQPASGGEPATWVIRDGKLKRRIGCRKDETSKAERALARYIEEKYESPRTRRDPSEIKIAEVIALYVDDVVSQHARPKETAARLGRILDFFDQGTLAGLTKGACKKYAEKRGKIAAARRELSDLNAAVRHHWAENRCTVLTPVILPGRRGIPRSRWLTRKEAAALLRACWRYREIQKGHEAGRRSLRHVARFILVGLYYSATIRMRTRIAAPGNAPGAPTGSAGQPSDISSSLGGETSHQDIGDIARPPRNVGSHQRTITTVRAYRTHDR